MASTGPRQKREAATRRRSRFGCRNCKLRKLKCDEGKPHCKRCRSYGVLCNFVSNISDLQPITADTGRSLVVQRPLTNAVWTSDASISYQLNAKCQDFITRYLGRSLITPNDPNMIQMNRKLLELAFAYPCLMHASLAVALTYDRHLNGLLDRPRTLEECYHWAQATVLFNKLLRQPMEAKDKDPIWGTAAALVILTFSSPEASTPEQAWPLNSSDSDLDWLRMSKGKMSLWHMVNPLRSDSLFRVMAVTFAHMLSPFPETGIDGIPRALAAVCNLGDTSTADNNPYFHAAHAVSPILDLPDSEVTMGPTQLFMRSIHGPFEDLLRNRDPIALLLLYLWYRKASRSIWWIELRARVECPAICLYLRLHHADNGPIQEFLPGGALTQVPL
ncbi:hypothetical protein BO94DRAFT_240223 [Aspergillus sclerotioniger CBS 115572]|uniref:Zn(2)-C6 fungal-type domain-containing protein n=1 Tax=Aspergillus sclerotioniger CBS 115572 TaxID=1450535 RepID=A0A317VMH1_9EURO|nr:hypothetical protein BO94DRAFT_240223 [Aspergillus sclerotioniger CBS 115572]PWY73110.1 hypothetical protein BO94DRAFT_240223 [Aspergillus sclerotioniger CBS 115572]